MKPTDSQIDLWLRDVDVPHELREQLLRIPTDAELDAEQRLPTVDVPVQVAVDKPSVRARYGQWWLVGAAVAAAFSGVVAWSFWSAGSSPVPREHTMAESEPPAAVNQGGPALLATVSELTEQVDELALAVDLQIKSRQLARLREQTRIGREFGLASSVESHALTEFAACESSVVWGREVDQVRAEMEQIVVRYPGTRGASRAAAFLADKGTHLTPVQ